VGWKDIRRRKRRFKPHLLIGKGVSTKKMQEKRENQNKELCHTWPPEATTRVRRKFHNGEKKKNPVFNGKKQRKDSYCHLVGVAVRGTPEAVTA